MDGLLWVTQPDDNLSGLDERKRTLVLAYEYILSDQWGKGTPDPIVNELKNLRVRKTK